MWAGLVLIVLNPKLSNPLGSPSSSTVWLRSEYWVNGGWGWRETPQKWSWALMGVRDQQVAWVRVGMDGLFRYFCFLSMMVSEGPCWALVCMERVGQDSCGTGGCL